MSQEIKSEDGTKTIKVKPTKGAKYPYERYNWTIAEFDVAKLWDAVDDDQAKHASTLDIDGAYKMIGAIMGVGLSSRVEGLNGYEYATTDDVDYSVPVLVVEYVADPRDPNSVSTLVVDGWSRIYKAHRDGFRSLPCYFFSDERVRELGAIEDYVRDRREKELADRVAIAEVVEALLDNMESEVERSKWRDLHNRYDLPYSEAYDDLRILIDEWKEGKKSGRD